MDVMKQRLVTSAWVCSLSRKTVDILSPSLTVSDSSFSQQGARKKEEHTAGANFLDRERGGGEWERHGEREMEKEKYRQREGERERENVRNSDGESNKANNGTERERERGGVGGERRMLEKVSVQFYILLFNQMIISGLVFPSSCPIMVQTA